jgi:hypothetical protein
MCISQVPNSPSILGCFTDSVFREVDFWIFFIFNILQFAIDWKNNSKTKVEKVFFFIFISSYAEMIFLKIKKSLNMVKTDFFLK